MVKYLGIKITTKINTSFASNVNFQFEKLIRNINYISGSLICIELYQNQISDLFHGAGEILSNQKIISLNSGKKGSGELLGNIYSMHHEHH